MWYKYKYLLYCIEKRGYHKQKKKLFYSYNRRLDPDYLPRTVIPAMAIQATRQLSSPISDHPPFSPSL